MKYGKIIILIILITMLFAGCDDKSSTSSDIEKPDLSTYTEKLADDFSYGCTVDRFTDYMENWSEDAVVDNYGNVIFESLSSEGYDDVVPLVLVVSYNPSFFSNDINNIALCQYLVENQYQHGHLTIILTENDLNRHNGALNLSTSYFPKDAQVLSLDSSYKTHASINTGNQIKMNLRLATEKTDENLFNTAYKIKITNVSTSVLDEQINRRPNPIKILGELLGYFKMKSMAYQLSDMNFETIGNEYPLGADITILINGYSEAKFISYMDSKISSFNKKYSETNPIVTYTYEKTVMPDKVYTSDSAEKIVSLLYTITNGNSLDTEDAVYAISTLSCVEDLGDEFSLCMLSNTRSKEALSNLFEEIETVSSFVGASLKKDSELEGFNGISDSPLCSGLNIAYEDELKIYDTVRYTNCSYLKNKNTDLDIVHVFVSPEDTEDITKAIMIYMIDSKNEE